MENKNNSTCSICGKEYHRCNSCNDSKLTPWRAIVDTVEHYKIYMIIRDYNNQYISKDDAKTQLEKLDLSDKDSFVEEIKNKINEIIYVAENSEVKIINKNKRKNKQETNDSE